MNLLYYTDSMWDLHKRNAVMNKQRSISVLVLLVASFWSGFDVKASLSEGLDQRLRTHNFNVYSVPSPANDMILHDMKGRPVSLSASKGKVVLLNFWRIDCPPCSIEKPILERVFRKHFGRGLEIVAVNLFDPVERQFSYVQSNGFSYTFACDPRNNFCIRQDAVGSKIPSSFVINSNSEAIYEIPGVPTTYVIDRQGRVVGNCVGLVNWEASPFAEFLESLLSKPRVHAAETMGFFETVARQGGPTSAGHPPDHDSPVATKLAQAGSGAASSEQPSMRLPFQAPASPDIQRDKPSPVSPPPGTDGNRQAGEPTKQVKKPKESEKGSQARQLSTSQTSASEVRSVSQGAKKKAGGGLPSGSQGTVPQPRSGVTFSEPYAPPSLPAAGGVGTVGSRTLLPLPPALPYTRPRASQLSTQRNVLPDQTGTVLSRIPLSAGPSSGSVPVQDRQGQSPGLPSARPLGTPNPIDGFILDSFGRAGQSQPVLIRPETKGLPPSSLLGQMGQDIRQLGTGIRETFSKLLPGL